jgi:hypothetical protein
MEKAREHSKPYSTIASIYFIFDLAPYLMQSASSFYLHDLMFLKLVENTDIILLIGRYKTFNPLFVNARL